jgi:hypothetical protein
VGLAIGVAVLIAVLGTPHSPAEVLAAYQRAWTVIAAIAFAGGIVGFLMLVRRPAAAIAPEAPGVASGVPGVAAEPVARPTGELVAIGGENL